MTFQEQLITFRKHQGLSQEQLGEKLGVTRQTVSKWELGVTTPEMDKLILLADLFHISIDELVGRETADTGAEPESGLLALGGIASGIFSLGGISAGLFSFGGLSAGLLLSVGGFSVGTVAIGGLALGIFAIGGGAFGVYALGGAAVAQKIAAGGAAQAAIAIGDAANGEIAIDINNPVPPSVIRDIILKKFPGTWDIIVEIFSHTV